MAKDATTAKTAPAKLVFMLDEPVTYNGEVYREITYRRPTGGDMRAWMNGRKGVGDDMLGLMVNIAEMPAAFFDALDGSDFMAFANELQPFLNGARKTSTT